jgi:hypothetical protein
MTWIQFIFKLDIFKNNVRFSFILKQICFKIIGIYFSINRACLFIEKLEEQQESKI